MDCKKCGAKMYERTAKNVSNSSTIYICSKCDTTIFVWPDGEVKEGTPGKTERRIISKEN